MEETFKWVEAIYARNVEKSAEALPARLVRIRNSWAKRDEPRRLLPKPQVLKIRMYGSLTRLPWPFNRKSVGRLVSLLNIHLKIDLIHFEAKKDPLFEQQRVNSVRREKNLCDSLRRIRSLSSNTLSKNCPASFCRRLFCHPVRRRDPCRSFQVVSAALFLFL